MDFKNTDKLVPAHELTEDQVNIELCQLMFFKTLSLLLPFSSVLLQINILVINTSFFFFFPLPVIPFLFHLLLVFFIRNPIMGTDYSLRKQTRVNSNQSQCDVFYTGLLNLCKLKKKKKKYKQWSKRCEMRFFVLF